MELHPLTLKGPQAQLQQQPGVRMATVGKAPLGMGRHRAGEVVLQLLAGLRSSNILQECPLLLATPRLMQT